MDEAAGAADAESYAFCLGVSRFVRVLGRFSVAIIKVGWSVGTGWEALGERFFTRASAGMGCAGMSRDSRAVGAEARAVENGMGSRLGRVKDWAPYGELPSSQCR